MSEIEDILFPPDEHDGSSGVPELHVCATLAYKFNKEGFPSQRDRELVRLAVACYLETWSAYNLTGNSSKWNLASFFICAYLRHAPVPELQGEIVLPPQWSVYDSRQTKWGTLDVHDALRGIAATWRRSPAPRDHEFASVRLLEEQVARVAADLWPDDAFQDCCQILGTLWGAENITKSLLGHSHGLAPELDNDRSDRIWKWLDRERDLTLQTKQTGSFAQYMMRAMARPGELQNYARNNGGVEAKNIGNVFTFSRTHVQAMGATNLTGKLDVRAACGILSLLLVDRSLKHRCGLDWFAGNVILDCDLMSQDAFDKVLWRKMPWILLLAGEWHVIDGKQSWRAQDAVHATWWWFEVFKRNESPDLIFDLFQGDAYDITTVANDASFPFLDA